MFEKKSFTDGLKASAPICLAFIFLFSSLGLLSNANNLSLVNSVLLSATIFAGPIQAFVINNQDASLWVVALNTFVLNFKFVLMSSMTILFWNQSKRYKVPGLFFMCSSAYLVCSAQKNVKDRWSFYIGVVLMAYFVSVLSTALGFLVWDMAVDFRSLLDALAHIVLPIHFVCLTVKRKKEKVILWLTLLGCVAAPLLERLVDRGLLIIVWFAIAFVCVVLEEKWKQKAKLCGQ